MRAAVVPRGLLQAGIDVMVVPRVLFLRPQVTQWRSFSAISGTGSLHKVICCWRAVRFCPGGRSVRSCARAGTARRALTLWETTGGHSRRLNLFPSGCLRPQGKVKAAATRAINYGSTEIDLTCVEQIAEASQTRAIARCLQHLGENLDGVLVDGQR